MSDNHDWAELIDRHLRGELEEFEKERLAELLDANPAARKEFVEQAQWDTRFADALRDVDGIAAERPKLERQRVSGPGFVQLILVAASIVIVALSAGLIYQLVDPEAEGRAVNRIATLRPTPDASIARITGLNGSLIWTGDRGRIIRDVSVGTELGGGTIEGLAPDSWFELQFNDGSTVMISGTSTLTFADAGQKELRLRKGILSANVAPQPAGRPMLIHTRSALLQVLGTRLDVKTSLTSTVLHVSEGRVRVKRLSDGQEVDVPAKYRVIAGDDGEMTPRRVPSSKHNWKSQLNLGPAKGWEYYGKWSPATAEQPASLRAISFVPQEDQSLTHHLLGLPVVYADNSPVVVLPHSSFAVRGRLEIDTDVFFGIRVAYPNGEFAGNFLTCQKVSNTVDDSRFELVIPLQGFTLDPCVRDRKAELAARPDGLVLNAVYAFTNTGSRSGLEVTEVELVPSVRHMPLHDTVAKPNSGNHETESE